MQRSSREGAIREQSWVMTVPLCPNVCVIFDAILCRVASFLARWTVTCMQLGWAVTEATCTILQAYTNRFETSHEVNIFPLTKEPHLSIQCIWYWLRRHRHMVLPRSKTAIRIWVFECISFNAIYEGKHFVTVTEEDDKCIRTPVNKTDSSFVLNAQLSFLGEIHQVNKIFWN